jgi:hypothetical protein
MSRNSISAWTACNIPSFGRPSSVIWSPKLKMWLITSGCSGSFQANALYSYDGINFGSYGLPFQPPYACGGGSLWLPEYERFVSLSTTGSCWLSYNGFDWTEGGSGLIFGAGGSVATRRGLGYSPQLRTLVTSRANFSTDGGLTWGGTGSSLGANEGYVVWSPELGIFLRSEQGIPHYTSSMYRTPITTLSGQFIVGITGASGGLTGGTGPTVSIIDLYPSIFLSSVITSPTASVLGGIQSDGAQSLLVRNNAFRTSTGSDVPVNTVYPQWDMVLSSQPGSDNFIVRRSPSGATTSFSNYLQVTATGSVLFNTYTSNGTLQTVGGIGAIAVSSDERVKDNIQYFDSFTGPYSLPKILQIRPASFTRKGCNDQYEGFIAQQVEQFLPLAVDGKKYDYELKRDSYGSVIYDSDGKPLLDYSRPRYRGLNDAAILAHVVQSIKEQHEIIENVVQRVENIERKL